LLIFLHSVFEPFHYNLGLALITLCAGLIVDQFGYIWLVLTSNFLPECQVAALVLVKFRLFRHSLTPIEHKCRFLNLGSY